VDTFRSAPTVLSKRIRQPVHKPKGGRPAGLDKDLRSLYQTFSPNFVSKDEFEVRQTAAHHSNRHIDADILLSLA
jgi:hypothetical protein